MAVLSEQVSFGRAIEVALITAIYSLCATIPAMWYATAGAMTTSDICVAVMTAMIPAVLEYANVRRIRIPRNGAEYAETLGKKPSEYKKEKSSALGRLLERRAVIKTSGFKDVR